MEYTVIGDCVNVASYLISLAGAGEIIIASDRKTNLEDFIDVERLEPQKIKNREERVNVFRVIGISSKPQ